MAWGGKGLSSADGWQISVLKRMNYRGNNISNINENTVSVQSRSKAPDRAR